MTPLTRSLRYSSAFLVLAAGAVHFMLWTGEYRHERIIGPLFLLNAAVAVLIAAALIWRPIGAFALAALVFCVATLVAFVLSRSTGLFGFHEEEWGATAILAAVAELGAVVAVGGWFAATRPAHRELAVVGRRVRSDRA